MAQDTRDASVPNPIQIQKYLRGIDYPTNKQGLIDAARQNNADERTVSALNTLSDRHYNSPNDVSEEIGKLR